MGLVNQTCDSEQLETIALQKAALIAKKPLKAILATKRLLKDAIKTQLKTAIQNEAKQFIELLNSKESKQIMTSFLMSSKQES